MTPRSKLLAEKRVLSEAKRLNRRIYAELLLQYQSHRLLEYVREVNLWIVESFLDSIVFGYAMGRKELQRGLKLSLEKPIGRLLDDEEFNLLRMQFESEATRWSAHLRSDLSDVMLKWARFANSEGLTPTQATKSLEIAFRIKGYSAKSARNIRNVFATGYHMGYNGVIYTETKNDPKVWGYEYVTAGDEKVRVSHDAQNGVTLPKSDPFWQVWWPPNGYNCRCTIKVLTKEHELVYPDSTLTPDEGFSRNPFAYFLGV